MTLNTRGLQCRITGTVINWPCANDCDPICDPRLAAPPRRFLLVRSTDETGISGTGVVADGVMFHDGSCAMRWTTATASTAIYASIEDVETIHGHGGATLVHFLDGHCHHCSGVDG